MTALFILQLVLFVGALFVLKIGRFSNFHPATLMLGSWTLAILFQLPGFIRYEYATVSLSLVIIQTIFVFAFLAGACPRFILLLGDESKEEKPRDAISPWLYWLLVGCVTIYVGCVTVELAQKGLSESLDIQSSRLEHKEAQGDYEHTLQTLLMSVVRPFVFFTVFAAPQIRKLRPLAIVCGISLGLVESLLVGGRAFLAFCLVGFVFSYLISRKNNTDAATRRISGFSAMTNLLGYGVMATLLVYLCFGVFPTWRNPDLKGNEERYLSYEAGKSRIAPRIKRIARNSGLGSVNVFAWGTHYLTSSSMRANYLLNETDVADWLFLGGNNFPLPSKVFALLTGRPSTSELQVKEKIASSQPFGKNPWVGGVVDVVIDFGIAGGALFMFLFGLFSGTVYRQVKHFGNCAWLVLYACLGVTLIAFPYTSTIRWSMTSYTVILGCVVAVSQALFSSQLGGARKLNY